MHDSQPSHTSHRRKRSARRQGALGALLLLTGVASVLLLLAALSVGVRSARVVRDVNWSGSLRYRSLWLYGATHGGGQDWHAQIAAMGAIRARLRARYPQDVAATDPAWNAVLDSLQRTGRVDWPMADALRAANNVLTSRIAARAAAQNTVTSLGLCLGLAFMICSLTMAARLLRGLRAAEDTLLAEREFTAALLESLQEGIVACDADGTLTLFNRATREFHGLPEQPLPAEQWAEHFDLYDADGLTPMHMQDIPLYRALQGEDVREAEAVIAPQNGPRRTTMANGRAIYGADGEKLGAVVAMHDVTERRQAEREMARFAAIVDSCSDAIMAVTLDGTLVSWNRGAERLYGRPAGSVIGRHFSELAPGGTENLVMGAVQRLLRGEEVEPVEVVRVRPDGSVVTLLLSLSPMQGASDEVIGVVGVGHDITERQAMEQALRESRQLAESIADSSTSIIFVFDLDAQANVYANRNVGEFLGYAPDQVRAMGADLLPQMLHPEDLPRVLSHFGDFGAAADGEVIEIEYRARHADGSWRWIWNREVIFHRHPDGTPWQILGNAQDVTERRRSEEALRESEARLRSLADAAFEGIVVSQDGRVVDANRAFAALLGYADVAEVIGRPADSFAAPECVEHVRRVQAERSEETYETVCLRRDGSRIHVEVRGRRGTWHGAYARVTAIRDITAHRSAQEALRESAEQLRRSEASLRTLLESAPVILYAADAEGTVTLSEGTGLAALGLKPGEAVGRNLRDFQGDAQSAECTRRALAGESVTYDTQTHGLWLHVALQPVRGEDGTAAGLIGVCFDVTERVVSEERFRVLFEQSSDAHMLVNGGGIIDCNNAAVSLLGCPDKTHLLGLHPSALSPETQPDGRPSREKGPEMEARARAQGTHRFEWTHRRMDGEEFPTEITLTPVALADGPALLAVWHDLTERKRAERQSEDYRVVLEYQKAELERANAELAALATTDGLTGLKNHRAFQERLAEEFSRADRYDAPLSLLLLDVDHFKQYNDAFGHPAGDDVLRRVARLLETSTRGLDQVARYGGEEFVVILPQTGADGARVIAERVRAAVVSGPWDRRPITVSIGVCTLTLGTPTPDALIASADAALYCSKAGGRNRVTHSGDPVEHILGERAALSVL